MNPTDILIPSKRRKSKAYLVNKLRNAVFVWRKEGYPNVSDTTRRLLNFWFEEDHLVDEETFQFWFCQREAIETLIYVYEVMKKRTFVGMARDFGKGPIQGYDPAFDQYPLYAFKMATGSGKTFVMALAIVWSYFNHKKENSDEYSSKFLIIAPNLIVYDRLKRDFQGGEIFKRYPFIPNEWKKDFDLRVFTKEDPLHVILEDSVFLTNIQQLEERNGKNAVEEYVDDVLKVAEPDKQNIYNQNKIRDILKSCPNVMILKDEAHHIYNTEKAWKKLLIELHKELKESFGKGINQELDFSATPRGENGALFPWIIVDFGLAESIEMNIIKRPLKGVVKGAQEITTEKITERYKAWIEAGIRRWREYKEKLEILGKKPLLFLMCEDTKAANEVYDYLNLIPDLKNKVLLIHTNMRTGDILKGDIEKAREAAKKVDEPDSPYDAIVSVMMLNEGWDVRNVNIIVGLRAYSSGRKVLPEQVIGRGLRKMFPNEKANKDSGVNILEVIGPKGLVEVIEELEKQEDIEFSEFDVDSSLNLTTIFVDEDKMENDIEIPILTPRTIIREFSLEPSIVNEIEPLNIKFEDKVLQTEYVAVDMIDGSEVIKRKWDLPVPKDPKSVIAYYTDQILKKLKIPGMFSDLYPIVKKYVHEKLFDHPVKLNDAKALYNLSTSSTQERLINIFVEKLRNMTFVDRKPRLGNDVIKLSNLKPFVWSRMIYPASKCIFNYVPCDNKFEVDFAKFLDNAEDIVSFGKIVMKLGFFVEYINSNENLKLYYPDFIVKTSKGEHLIVETKGRVDVDVKRKDERIKKWCEDATILTNEPWNFIRVDEELFRTHQFNSLEDLEKLLGCSMK